MTPSKTQFSSRTALVGHSRCSLLRVREASPTRILTASVNIPRLAAYEQARRALRRECEPNSVAVPQSKVESIQIVCQNKKEITTRAISLLLVDQLGLDSRANCALGLPRSRTSTGGSLCTASPQNPLGF